MVIRFNNDYLQHLFEDLPVVGKPVYQADVIEKFKKTILKLQFASNTHSLRNFRGLNFEPLKGNLLGFYSVRVDKRYRLIFKIEKDNAIVISEIIVVEELSNHYD